MKLLQSLPTLATLPIGPRLGAALALLLLLMGLGTALSSRQSQEQLLKLGTVQRALLLQRKVLGDDRIYTYELRYATESLIVTLGLAPDNKVSLFTIRPKLPPLAG